MGSKEHRLEMEQITKKLHFDQPINLQFTSVSISMALVIWKLCSLCGGKQLHVLI